MSQIVLQGDTSGQTVIQAPSTGTQTVTLPAATGTALVNPLPTGTSISASTGDVVRFTGNGVSFPTWTTSARPPGPGTGATATVTVSGGVIQTVTITNQGSNYVNGAAISFTGSGGGTGASATLTTTGGVVNTTVSNLVGGTGYTGTVTATITGVPYTGQTGYNTTLSVNETYNGTSWVAVANTASSAGINFSDGSNIISHAVPQVTVLSAANNSATGTTTSGSLSLTLNSAVTGVIGVGSQITSTYLATNISPGIYITGITTNVPVNNVTLTGSISGNILTVTAISSGTLAVGQVLSTSSAPGTATTLPSIVYQISGTTGSTGTYYLTGSTTLASTTIYANALISTSVLTMSNYPLGVVSSTTFTFATPNYGVYTVPTNCKYLYIKMVGGGGGGGSGTGASPLATAGGNTTFGTSLLSANGGGQGYNVNNVNSGNLLGIGGNSSITSTTGVTGLTLSGANATIGAYYTGGTGGSTPFGGAGAGCIYGNAQQITNGSPNTGSGGGAWGTTAAGSYNSAVGGGAAGYIEAYITSPASTYVYYVAIGGNGAQSISSSSPGNGGNGGSGVIIVTAFF